MTINPGPGYSVKGMNASSLKNAKLEAHTCGDTSVMDEVYILPRNHWISFATSLVYSGPVIETPVFSEIHGKCELDIDRCFEAQIYPYSLKEYQTFGPERKTLESI